MTLKPIADRKLYLRIAEEIGRLIDGGTFVPGDRLPAERSLAQSLRVSRSSLREALGALEIAGRIEIRVGAGAYVLAKGDARVKRPRRRAEIPPFDVLRARRLIEGEAAALAARHATPAQLQAMAKAFDRLAADMRANRAASGADRRFHLAIASASGNSALALVIAQLWDQSDRPLSARIESLFVTGRRRRDNVAEHRAVLDAIAAHDAPGARRAMRRHLANAERQRMVRLRRSA